ncbi:MAG: gliding motility-associated protein GldE [Bacteroidetes bacterium]|nr:gliding motility-associated protein GldE [Bacteroidota bacterium]
MGIIASEPGIPPAAIILLSNFSAGNLVEIGVIFLLILIAAAISGSESAFFSLKNKDLIELQESKHPFHKTIIQLLEKPKELLASILIINTLVNIAVAILAADFMHSVLPGDSESAKNLRFFIEIVTVTFTLVLLGEVTPKVYAAHYNRQFATVMAYPMFILNKILYPISFVMIQATKVIEKRIDSRGHDLKIDEIRHAIEITSDDKTTLHEKKILKGVISFSTTNVKQIMTSRIDIVAHDIETPFEELLKNINENRYSRLPVYKERLDEVVGILYIKDLIPHLSNKENFEWQSLIRKPMFVPESKMIDDLLQEFKTEKIHMAVVVDEYGGTQGIITLEDILEEIVGDISDEFDDDEIFYSRLDDNNFIFTGKTSLSDVIKVMSLEEDTFEKIRGEVETIGGMVVELKGEIPKIGEIVSYQNFSFKIESADKKKINRIKITYHPATENGDE